MGRHKRKPARYDEEDFDDHQQKTRRSSRKKAAEETESRHSSKSHSRSSSRRRSSSHRDTGDASERPQTPQPSTSRHRLPSPSQDPENDDEPSLRQQLREMRQMVNNFMQQMRGPSVAPSAAPSVASVHSERPEHENPNYYRDNTPSNTGILAEIDPNVHLAQFAPPPRPVVTAGVDIGAHVSANLKAKIWRDDYVDLSQLLPTSQFQQETYTLSIDPSKNSNLGFKLNRPKLHNMTFDQWEDAFLIYMSIYTARYSVAPEMCTYIRDVKMLANSNANFRFYDEQFRMYRSSTHCEWNVVHNGIWFQATHPVRPSNKSKNSSNSNHQKQPFRVPHGYCTWYHLRGKYCNSPQSCKYKHTCPNCSASHPMYTCSERRNNKSDSTNSAKSYPKSTASKPANTNQTK